MSTEIVPTVWLSACVVNASCGIVDAVPMEALEASARSESTLRPSI